MQTDGSDRWLAPYQYEYLWVLAKEPLSAGELAQTFPAHGHTRYNASPVLATANRLRALVRLGLLDNDGGIYRVTEKAHRRFEL